MNRAKDWTKTFRNKVSQNLEAKLQAQGIELKAQDVEQIQQLDEKLREQSTQRSEQLQQLAATLDLKMQQKAKSRSRSWKPCCRNRQARLKVTSDNRLGR